MKHWFIRSAGLFAAGVMVYLSAQAPQPDGAGVERGVLPAKWLTGGPKCMETPEWQVHEYNADFYILRESGCTHYEKPFLYLIFGDGKAMLMDTGAGDNNVAEIVNQTVAKWLKRKGRESIPLMVMHSHGHSDHVAGDKQFIGQPNVEFIPATVEAVSQAFKIAQWPVSIGSVDLGGRVLDVIPIPGHHQAAIALYDRRTGLYLSGDNVYPGRLYISDWAAFTASTKRMVDFARGKIITHVLGCHIEQTKTPYLEYPIGSIYQPDEATLEMSRGHLLELLDALETSGGPKRIALRDMTLWPMTPEALSEMRETRKRVETAQRQTMWGQK